MFGFPELRPTAYPACASSVWWKTRRRGPIFTVSGRKWVDTGNSCESLAQPESKVHPDQGTPWMVEAREKIFSLVIGQALRIYNQMKGETPDRDRKQCTKCVSTHTK